MRQLTTSWMGQASEHREIAIGVLVSPKSSASLVYAREK